ncbi:Heme oxygenase [Pseudomonas syringae pv. solidagae]|uniref:Heme oxygenase n=5 Tax=Pseudomonas TaxID=286 RepID=A0A0P9ZUT0_PSESX|nr:Heme oxygenase [Pseudomonas syringae pv. solidagae]RMT43095.1 Heme oxygenase [Pseudomonas syringae pv. solidagae]
MVDSGFSGGGKPSSYFADCFSLWIVVFHRKRRKNLSDFALNLYFGGLFSLGCVFCPLHTQEPSWMPASFPRVTPPKLLDALRAETSQLHVRLEKRMPFFSSALDHALYLRLLQAYYGFYAPLEAVLHGSALVPAELVPAERVKTPVLVEDLRALGMSDHDIGQLPRCQQLPAIDSPGACLGVMYVLEGATLGGQVLRREINKRLGLDGQSGTAFLDVYGARTGPRWKAFLNHLDEVSREVAFNDAAAFAAHSTFACFEHWLEGQKVLL